ncbi:glycosyltransferase [Thermaurantiacus sp.]
MAADPPTPFAAPLADLSEPPRASVILPHLNTPELLVRALQSLARQRLAHGWFEVIVVDNGSRMPLDAVRAAWPHVRFLRHTVPGPGPARSFGVAHAASDWLAFTDADMQVAPDWLETGLRALAADPSRPIGGTVRILRSDPARPTAIETFEELFSFRQKHYIEREGFSGTGNLMMHRRVHDLAGPFDGIGMAEDKAFGRRAAARGAPTRFVPEMIAYHPARTSLADLRGKYARVDQHLLAAHLSRGGSVGAWRLRAVAMALSALAHAPRFLLATGLSLADRVRGLGILLAIRSARARAIWADASSVGAGRLRGDVAWNR